MLSTVISLALAVASAGAGPTNAAAPRVEADSVVYVGTAHATRAVPSRVDADATIDGKLDEPVW